MASYPSPIVNKSSNLNYNWKKISKELGKNEQKISQFIQIEKNKLTTFLLATIKQRNLVNKILRKLSTQACFNNIIFNDEEVLGEINIVIASVLLRWEEYCKSILLTGKAPTYQNGGSLKMNTENDLIGYFVQSLNHQLADLYVKHTAQKRAGSEVVFSTLHKETEEENTRSFEDSISGSDFNDHTYKEYKKDIISYLRSYDKSNKTNFARFFVMLMNPRYNGSITYVQKKMKLTTASFREKLKKLSSVVNSEFGDISSEIIDYFDFKKGMFQELSEGTREIKKYKDRSKKAQASKKPCRLNIIYGQRPSTVDFNVCTYYATVLVDRSKTQNETSVPENWENVLKVEKKIDGKHNEMSKMKPKLEKLISTELNKAQKIVEESKKAA